MARALPFRILVVAALVSLSPAQAMFQPVREQVTGVTGLIQFLEQHQVTSLTQARGVYHWGRNYHAARSGKAPNAADGKTWLIYLYSPKWGWLDFHHMIEAAYQTDRWYLAGNDVLMLGELEEARQAKEANAAHSAWAYEDLTSNLLGVYFEVFLEYRPGVAFPKVVEEYLRTLGFVENPLQAAPNGAVLLRDGTEGSNILRDQDYLPKFTDPSVPLNDLDRAVLRYRKVYLMTRPPTRF
jgi:hypothetical protein